MNFRISDTFSRMRHGVSGVAGQVNWPLFVLGSLTDDASIWCT
jgi:hypothetical protein